MNIPYTYLIGWKSLNKFYYGRRTSKNCHPTDLWTTYFTSSPDVKKFVKQHGNPDLIEVRKVFDKSPNTRDRIRLCVDWENRVLERINAAKNPLFLNKSNGDARFDASGMASVIDSLTGDTAQVTIEELKNNPHRYKGILSGFIMVTVIESGVVSKITTEEFHKNRHLYKHHSEGIINVIDISSNKSVKITTEEFHKNRHLYKHVLEGVPVRDEIREKIKKSNTGKPKTNKHRENISKALTGKKKTPEHVKNSQLNRTRPFKAVIINGIYFPSVNSAAAHFGVRHSTISNLLAGRKKLSTKFWEVKYANPD